MSALLLAAPILPASLALADADPASDTLVSASVFYPYTSQVSSQLQKKLNAQTAAASQAQMPIKVALIAAPLDLGGLPTLFGKPQQYAKFLDQEITFNRKPPLLVVMPSGFGVAGLSPAATAAAASLAKPGGKTGDDLAQSALAAIPKLAAASGVTLAPVSSPPPATSGGGGSSPTTPEIVLVAAIAVLATGAIITYNRRQAPPH